MAGWVALQAIKWICELFHFILLEMFSFRIMCPIYSKLQGKKKIISSMHFNFFFIASIFLIFLLLAMFVILDSKGLKFVTVS